MGIDIHAAAGRLLRRLNRHQERYIRAWIAATGIHPTKAKLVQRALPGDGLLNFEITIEPIAGFAAGPWIPVTERMPELGVPVFIWQQAPIFGGKVSVFAGVAHRKHCNKCDYWDSDDYLAAEHVTHWAEINPPGGTE